MKRSPKPATEETTHGSDHANCSARRNGLIRSIPFITRALRHERVSYPSRESFGRIDVDLADGWKMYQAQVKVEATAATATETTPPILVATQQIAMMTSKCGTNFAAGFSHVWVKVDPKLRAMITAIGTRKSP